MQAKKPKNGVKIKPKSKEHYVNSREFKEAIAAASAEPDEE